jgi:hypothetical protein
MATVLLSKLSNFRGFPLRNFTVHRMRRLQKVTREDCGRAKRYYASYCQSCGQIWWQQLPEVRERKKRKKESQKGRLTITNSSCSDGTSSMPTSTDTWQKYLDTQLATRMETHPYVCAHIHTYIHTYIHTVEIGYNVTKWNILCRHIAVSL